MTLHPYATPSLPLSGPRILSLATFPISSSILPATMSSMPADTQLPSIDAMLAARQVDGKEPFLKFGDVRVGYDANETSGSKEGELQFIRDPLLDVRQHVVFVNAACGTSGPEWILLTDLAGHNLPENDACCKDGTILNLSESDDFVQRYTENESRLANSNRERLHKHIEQRKTRKKKTRKKLLSRMVSADPVDATTDVCRAEVATRFIIVLDHLSRLAQDGSPMTVESALQAVKNVLLAIQQNNTKQSSNGAETADTTQPSPVLLLKETSEEEDRQ